MKLDKAVFGIILAIGAVVGLALFVPEAPNGHGVIHSEFPSMLAGGSAQRHEGILWVGWAFGILQLFLYGTLMAFGSRKGATLRGLGRPLIYGTAIQIATLTAVVLTYRATMGESTPSSVLAFPTSTAVFIYVLWPLTVLFNLLFVFGFQRWVLTDSDLAQYEQLVAAASHRRRAKEVSGAPRAPATPTEPPGASATAADPSGPDSAGDS